MGRRRRHKPCPTHPQLFPGAEENLPLPTDALQETFSGLAELLLAAEGSAAKGGDDDESEDQA